MSFRLADLKRSVRKSREGYRVTPARLEGRSAEFQIQFVLEQFEDHLGRPRRELDPAVLLDFVGDSRLGRGLLAALSQWYRMRPRTFAEVLDPACAGDWRARFQGAGIAGPVELRAWLFSGVNRTGNGYLDPAGETPFWEAKARALGIRRDDLVQLMLLDRTEEAVLVRTGPRPVPADVMAAYNARAHTTLLRSAVQVSLRSDAPPSLLECAARAWAGPLEVEWRVEGQTLSLLGRADALGCWTRHGRRLENAALELLALPDLGVREVQGRLEIAEKRPCFQWNAETLSRLGLGHGAPLDPTLPDRIAALTSDLRRERERGDALSWGIRRPSHLLGAAGGVLMPHLELRCGDLSLYLRLAGPEPGDISGLPALEPFAGKSPVALVTGSAETEGVTLRFPGGDVVSCPPGEVLKILEARVSRLQEALAPPKARQWKLKVAA
jgi:hypothetical protein